MDVGSVAGGEGGREEVGEDGEGEVGEEGVSGCVVEGEADEEEEDAVGQRVEMGEDEGGVAFGAGERARVLTKYGLRRDGFGCGSCVGWTKGVADLVWVLSADGHGHS